MNNSHSINWVTLVLFAITFAGNIIAFPARGQQPDDGNFINMSAGLIPPDWETLIKGDLMTETDIYLRRARLMNGINVYPGSRRSRIPIYIPAKQGIADLLRISRGDVAQSTDSLWEICAENDLPVIHTISHNGESSRSRGTLNTDFAFTYAATGSMRADGKGNTMPARVDFDFLMIGTALQKHRPESATERPGDSPVVITDLGVGGGIRYVLTFTKRNAAYALFLAGIDCDGNGSCTSSLAPFLRDIRKNVKLVGGFIPTEGEIAAATASVNSVFEDNTNPETGVDDDAVNKFAYENPGNLYERDRPGIENYLAFTPGIDFQIFDDKAYFVKDHRELKKIIANNENVADFYKYPWQDSFCASGVATDARCMGNRGSFWQDVFPATCRPIDIGAPFHAYPKALKFDFLDYKIGVTAQGDILITKFDQVTDSRSAADCGFVRYMSIVNTSTEKRFTVMPPYASFVAPQLKQSSPPLSN